MDVNMLPRDPENQNCDMMGRRQTSGTRATGERHPDHNLPVSTHLFFQSLLWKEKLKHNRLLFLTLPYTLSKTWLCIICVARLLGNNE